MSSRLFRASAAASVLATIAAGALLAGARAADPATELPAAGCQTFADPTADAHPGNSNVPNDDDLDITAFTLRTTATQLVGYIKVVKLGDGPTQSTDGHRFTIDFGFGGHAFSMSGSHYKNNTGTIRDTIASTGQAGHVTQLGVDVPAVGPGFVALDKGFKDSGLVATFDKTNNYVVLALPIADIVKYDGGVPFTGKITAVDAKATVDNYQLSTQVDSTNKANGATADLATVWNIGDNKCFTVATKIALTVAKAAATRVVTAKLTSTAGAAIAGKPVAFVVNGKKVSTVVTGANGTATLKTKPGATVTAIFTAMPGFLGSSATTKT